MEQTLTAAVRPVVVLVAFYNKKALGVRYLETALEQAGYVVHTIFYKDFNSVHPTPTTPAELELLRQEVEQAHPVLVGLSVMSSMYLDTVYRVMDALAPLHIPLACGGAYATMFPQPLLEHGARFVIRSDGEIALFRLVHALVSGGPWRDIPSLCFRDGDEVVLNPIGDVLSDVDGYGLPAVRCRDTWMSSIGATPSCPPAAMRSSPPGAAPSPAPTAAASTCAACCPRGCPACAPGRWTA